MRFTRSRALLAAAVTAALAGPVGFIVHGASAASTGCAVSYPIGSQWPDGFTGNVTVTNLGDPLTGWTLTWTFTAGQQVTQGWNGTFSQSGTKVTVAGVSWNAALGTGGSATAGFNGSWNNTS